VSAVRQVQMAQGTWTTKTDWCRAT